MGSLGNLAGVGAGVPSHVVEQANALYWGSDASVNRLAGDLDLSKGALYEIITPFPVGIPCPTGDGEMVFANRTARDRGFVSCPVCGLEEEEARIREQLEQLGRVPETEFPEAPRLAQRDHSLRRVLIGTATLGAAAGFVLARLLRRS